LASPENYVHRQRLRQLGAGSASRSCATPEFR